MTQLNRGLTEYKIMVQGTDEVVTKVIRDALLNEMLDERLLGELHTHFMNTLKANPSKKALADLLVVMQYILDDYDLFKDFTAEDAIKVASKMLKIMGEEERMKLDSYTTYDFRLMISHFIGFLDKINGAVIKNEDSQLVMNVWTVGDVVESMKNVSSIYSELLFKIDYLEPNGTNGTVCFRDGIVQTPKETKVQPLRPTKVIDGERR